MLPVYNARRFIEASVRSILAQSFADFELVIGDDGSTDGTGAVLARLAAGDARIRLLRRERPSGLVAAANWVVREARAPLVAIAHADDLSHPDRLRAQVRLLQAAPDVALVGTLWKGIDADGRIVRPADFWRLRFASPLAPFSHSSVMFRRAAFEAAGGYRQAAEYWEDLDLYHRIAAAGRIAVLPFAYSMVRHVETSAMLHARRERAEGKIDAMLRAVARVRAGGSAEEVVAEPGQKTRRLHPLTFVRYGSTRVWTGRRPQTWARLWARGRLRFDVDSARALAWVLWGSVSPRSLRAALRLLMHARNAVARPLLPASEPVAWMPLAEASAAASAPQAREDPEPLFGRAA